MNFCKVKNENILANSSFEVNWLGPSNKSGLSYIEKILYIDNVRLTWYILPSEYTKENKAFLFVYLSLELNSIKTHVKEIEMFGDRWLKHIERAYPKLVSAYVYNKPYNLFYLPYINTSVKN